MTGKRIGYIRVSTIEQNTFRQLEGINLDKKFVDHASGKDIKRPQLEALIDYVRDDDEIIIHSMDRLARNLKDMRNLLDIFVSKGCKVHFLKENIIFSGDDSPISKLLLNIMGAVAEFEREIILERQREGIAIAQRAGKYKGRKKSLSQENIDWIREQLKTRKTISSMAQDLNISRFTLYNYINEYGLKSA